MKRSSATVIVAAMALLPLAGCGNAPESDGSATSSSAAKCVTQGVTKDSVTIGASLPLSGPLAVTAPIDAGRVAYFDKVNADGGVNGRKIEYKKYDDQGAADRTASNVRRLVEQDKVFALTGVVGTVQGLGVVDYLKTGKVPFVFPVSGSGAWSTPVNPLVFGFQPVYPDESAMFAHYINENFAGKKVAVLAQSDDAGTEWVTPFEKTSEELGTKPAAVERFDLAAQSLSSQVLNLQRSKAAVVAVFGRVDVVAKVLQEADKLGYHPQLVVSNIGLSAQLFTLVKPELAQGVEFASYFPPADSTEPAVTELRDALAKYQPKFKVDAFSMLGWASAETIVEGIEKAGDSLTCNGFLKGMESVDNFATGLTPPITMSAQDHQAVGAQQIVKVDGTGFATVTGYLDADGKPVGK